MDSHSPFGLLWWAIGPMSGSLQCGGKPQCPKRYKSFWNAKLASVILASLRVILNSSASLHGKGPEINLYELLVSFLSQFPQLIFFFFFFWSLKIFPRLSIYKAHNVPYWWFIRGVVEKHVLEADNISPGCAGCLCIILSNCFSCLQALIHYKPIQKTTLDFK